MKKGKFYSILKGQVLPITLAASMAIFSTGCKTSPVIPAITSVTDITYEKFDKESIFEESPLEDEKIIQKLKDNGITIQKVNNTEEEHLYLVTSLDVSKISKDCYSLYGVFEEEESYDELISHDEISNLIGKENITWEDVKTAINDNQNIPKDVKKMLLNGVDNLKNAGFNYDLSALYYNMTTINVEYGKDNAFALAGGYFDPNNHYFLIDKDMFTKNGLIQAICHEAEGHGSMEAKIEKDGKKYYYTTHPHMIKIDAKNNKIGYYNFGLGLNESLSELIAVYASGIKREANDGYPSLLYELIVTSSLLNLDLNSLINSGSEYLVYSLENNHIQSPISIVRTFDKQLKCYVRGTGYNGSPNRSFKTILHENEGLIIDGLLSAGYSEDEIYERASASDTVTDNYFNYKNGGIITINENGTTEYIKPDCRLYLKEYLKDKSNELKN